MSDKTVGELTRATAVTQSDLFVTEQNGEAKSVTGQVLMRDLAKMLDGHGGIKNIAKVSSEGLVDTYEIITADGTVFPYTVTNGKSPTIKVIGYQQISDGRNGVQITVNNVDGSPTQQVYVFDGVDGVTPHIATVETLTLVPGSDAYAEITGEPANLTLKMGIPAGRYPTISTTPKRDSTGRLGVTININNPDGTVYMATVYDGKDGESPKPVFVISGSYNGGTYWVHKYSGEPATVEEMVDAFFGGGICREDVSGDTISMNKIQGSFVISNDTVSYSNLQIYGGTSAQYQAAMYKYLSASAE